ncbi:unnamed protein product [Danaus chrysippus]|uniref:(African queen) hypothetical protein n=1 Tax=Danaus chrysippus TaxID=151541 RepID=A0A8J2QJQ0_9NEOP|nr:unnamed protein product [Danaus chrysippus]
MENSVSDDKKIDNDRRTAGGPKAGWGRWCRAGAGRGMWGRWCRAGAGRGMWGRAGGGSGSARSARLPVSRLPSSTPPQATCAPSLHLHLPLK